jgi:hypothetical protein
VVSCTVLGVLPIGDPMPPAGATAAARGSRAGGSLLVELPAASLIGEG